ncbi:MAG: hypothetical protein ACI4ES_06645 [Roseburia sp.]
MNNKVEQRKEILVGGFLFQDEKTAEQAKREVEGVQFIQDKIDKAQPKMVLQVYNQVIRQKMFETAVGQTYLKDLQEYLRAVPEIRSEDILPIPVGRTRGTYVAATPQRENKPPQKKTTNVKAKNVDYKKSFHTALILNIAFIICIIFMFLINLTSDSVTILNYESKLIDKYEQWENELEEREQILREKENALQ